jgi:ParB-like chromosome segregation protein Spo0J
MIDHATTREPKMLFHPLADMFPLMEGAEFDKLVADIKANGLREKIDLYQGKILDGRNRYRAVQRLGIDPSKDDKQYFRKAIYAHSVGGEVGPHEQSNDDRARAFIISKNIHRRHLTAEQKRELIAKLIKAAPEKSDRQIAKIAQASPTTVGTERAQMEAKGDVSKLDTRRDTKGRKQPATKKKFEAKQPAPKPVKHDDRVISPELGERVGRFADKLIRLDVNLARELVELILQRGVAERLWADLGTGIKLGGRAL